MAPRALRVGLTGGIASGKSHVLRRLAADGFRTLDLDHVAHELMVPGGAAYAEVVAAFGPGILDAAGAIDRRALGAIVFADPHARLRLNALVHPRVRLAEEAWQREAGAGEVTIVDAALLVETGLHLRFDRLVVVRCSTEQQLERLRHRDGVSGAAAEARLAAQMDPADKVRFAHFEIDSSGLPADTDSAVDTLAGLLRRLASRPPQRAPLEPAGQAAWLARLGPAAPPLPAPTDVLAAATSGVLELTSLLARLDPPRAGAWHDGPGTEMPPGPEAWASAAAVGLIAAATHPGDIEWAAAAGYALGRLVFTGPGDLAGSALAAVAACDLASAPAASDVRRWEQVAARFVSAAPQASARRYVESLARA
ncbi:MAG: dephospho-CoA kinase [Vicinamibacteria bacterium]|jgi:dephospho-CoA kinase|nr:dephospho-CoA kinase [Vicinamibacteria bacterium]